MKLVLEGRVAGPWGKELERAWQEMTSKIGSRSVSIDLKNVTYADASGKRILRTIFSESGATLAASSLATQDLAQEVAQH
ncbi:MAG TPA: hypothetical protein VHZ28_05870 [Terracidiphilus sp.]|jgi:anti-anti-sigma regulatory factor|nr:hypothetical protein [Terracidiphilus sp.]